MTAASTVTPALEAPKPARMSVEERAKQCFDNDVKDHGMEILRNDGVYRHLRFKRPGSSCYWFDLITWPGCLAIRGDMGAWMFARTTDMFTFFGGPGINPHYWGEKLVTEGGRRSSTEYSADSYREQVEDWYRETVEDQELTGAQAAELRKAIVDDLLDEWPGEWNHSEHAAHRALADFDWNGITIGDTWEWNLREYGYHYVWCCWAIVYGRDRFWAHLDEQAARPWWRRAWQAVRRG